MWKYAALISYVGTDYCGWQRQDGSGAGKEPSIQGTIEGAILQMTGEDVSVVGSGRTDAGVHALGQVAHFRLASKEWDPKIVRRGLNSILPQDIQCLDVRPVAMDFHAQRSADKKQYSYYFQQGLCALPQLEPISWWIYKKLDIEAIREALSYLKGEHDFAAFQASGAKPGSTTVRTILEAEATFEPLSGLMGVTQGIDPGAGAGLGFGNVRIRLVGTGFLKHMVRGITGTLLEVGEGRRQATSFRDILVSKDRKALGPTAPARALWLERVWYPARFELGW